MASLDPSEIARKKIQEAIANGKTRDEQARNAIWAATVVCAGLGVVPLGINTFGFVGVTSVLVISLASIYEKEMSQEAAGRLIKQIFTSGGLMYAGITLAIKLCAEVFKGVGIFTLGGPTAAGMAIDAVLCGSLCYAVGHTTKEYFKKNGTMSQEEMKNIFKNARKEGVQEIKNQKNK